MVLISVVGCTHGELDQIYGNVRAYERSNRTKIDLLICCGDFQAMRNQTDLSYLHCPPKYRTLHDFHKYYDGSAKAPVLTVFIGGNHENTAFGQELPHGGWMAPNIYYMGFGSVVNFGGLRIAGWSGIYKEGDFNYRESAIDIFMTHDWPQGITEYGKDVILYRQQFALEDKDKTLGNPHAMELSEMLKPKRYFAAHMHFRFEAVIPYPDGLETKFMALNKTRRANVLQQKRYQEFLELTPDVEAPKVLSYDAEWLAILRNTRDLETAKRAINSIPTSKDGFKPTAEQIEEVKSLFNNDLTIPADFKQTGPINSAIPRAPVPALFYRNPHTKAFCEKLGIPDWNGEQCATHEDAVGIPYYAENGINDEAEGDGNEIALDDDDEDFDEDGFVVDTKKRGMPLDDLNDCQPDKKPKTA